MSVINIKFGKQKGFVIGREVPDWSGFWIFLGGLVVSVCLSSLIAWILAR